MNFAVPADHCVKLNESKKVDKYFDLTWELKRKGVEHEGVSDISCSWCNRNDATGSEKKKTGGVGNQREDQDHPNSSVVKIC